jgi:hypothetical protein
LAQTNLLVISLQLLRFSFLMGNCHIFPRPSIAHYDMKAENGGTLLAEKNHHSVKP